MKKEAIKFRKGVKADDVLKKLIETYTEPVFGSQTKRELDLAFYHAMVDLGIIDSGADIYSLVEKLRITRTKARNLIYESKLRNIENENLDKEVERLLQDNKMYITDGKILLEIDNPLLSDYVRSVLKNNGYITDGSFSPELIRLSVNAYLFLCGKYSKSKFSKIEKILKDNGLIESSGVVNDIREALCAVLKDLHAPFSGTIDELSKIITNNIRDKNSKLKRKKVFTESNNKD